MTNKPKSMNIPSRSKLEHKPLVWETDKLTPLRLGVTLNPDSAFGNYT